MPSGPIRQYAMMKNPIHTASQSSFFQCADHPSRCGTGQTAPSSFWTSIRHLPLWHRRHELIKNISVTAMAICLHEHREPIVIWCRSFVGTGFRVCKDRLAVGPHQHRVLPRLQLCRRRYRQPASAGGWPPAGSRLFIADAPIPSTPSYDLTDPAGAAIF